MKKIKLVLLMSCLCLGLVACGGQNNNSASTDEKLPSGEIEITTDNYLDYYDITYDLYVEKDTNNFGEEEVDYDFMKMGYKVTLKEKYQFSLKKEEVTFGYILGESHLKKLIYNKTDGSYELKDFDEVKKDFEEHQDLYGDDLSKLTEDILKDDDENEEQTYTIYGFDNEFISSTYTTSTGIEIAEALSDDQTYIKYMGTYPDLKITRVKGTLTLK